MADEPISVEKLQELISRGPFNKWLNFTVLKAGADGVDALFQNLRHVPK